ncbi:hypothetical protein JAAARDRAFT_438096 [Jaapia argillacea MUCL 33604]|uniref:Heme haloperoxidase family profile domain-containing protein n=1 Tax=Jaapia argillacea MUCL 33604 TaxID=933084 RepID=A0A067PEJ6_9AGAM|nr:hypothetical protein JAAARDRAFT_438096 [Jaapia argillacea MUCL 33604]
MLFRTALLSAWVVSAFAYPAYEAALAQGQPITFPPPLPNSGSILIPDAAHPYIPPGPSDQRGPCPGLNTMANHGYLPRNGIVSSADIINGAQEAFNVDYNFSVALASFALLSRGNVLLDRVSLGLESPLVPPLPGNIDGTPGGLGKHGRFEGDVSMTRQDFDLGDNVHFQQDMYDNLLTYVSNYSDGNVVSERVFQEYRYARFVDSYLRNPNLTFHVGRHGFGYGEAGFTLNFFPNAKEGNLTVPVMNSFFQNERFPEGWYRRATRFTFADVSNAANEVEAPYPVPAGAKNTSGVYVPDGAIYVDTGCGLYLNLAGDNVPAVLLNTTGTLRQNVDTFIGGIYNLFAPFGCSLVEPSGPAGV